MAGKARWGDLPTATSINSEEGGELLDRVWKVTKEEFQRDLDRVREALDELKDEAIMHDEDLARHAFHQIGAYERSTVFLYNEYGTGIWHRDQLGRIVKESNDLWIVPADTHL